ncbi:hypothetical protein GF324_12880, partial [bacterium]|nr:hypothetical protein [bacterium]
MIQTPPVYKNFPLRVVLYRAPLLLVTIGLGAFVSFYLGWIALAAFLLYTTTSILWIMAHSCKNCAYHGRRCDLGVSLLATVLHPQKGTPAVFRQYTIVGIWLLLGMLAVPMFLGAIGLALKFSFSNLVWFGLYIAAAVAAVWTTVLSCPNCAMRGRCPASFYRPPQSSLSHPGYVRRESRQVSRRNSLKVLVLSPKTAGGQVRRQYRRTSPALAGVRRLCGFQALSRAVFSTIPDISR